MPKALLLSIFHLFIAAAAAGAVEIGDQTLLITLQQGSDGVELAAVSSGGRQLNSASSPLFSLTLQRPADGTDTVIDSIHGWGRVTLETGPESCRITFARPQNSALPPLLAVTVSLEVAAGKSAWDLRVSGIGSEHSLISTLFPQLHISAPGNDYLLIPKYSGTLIENPADAGVDLDLFYPRGWSATMPFLAYYDGTGAGLYLGFHDPDASLKNISVSTGAGGIELQGGITAPDRTRTGNDWEMPGHVELDVFRGTWYEAALIYRQWMDREANYRPRQTTRRRASQAALGRVGIWGYCMEPPSVSMEEIERQTSDFIDFFQGDSQDDDPVTVGLHWYRWNGKEFDEDYPDYFPERQGMAGVVERLQNSGTGVIMPYINGRLYDTDLTGDWDFHRRALADTAKRPDGGFYSQIFNNNTFAVMCPTRTQWQQIIGDAAVTLTRRLGSGGIYIDQVCAAAPVECMDAAHNHPLGGGHWWRDGYREMFSRLRAAMPEDRFVVVEGGADYLADQVDGFLTDGWTGPDLVPAFQAVYSGRVQLIGKRTGTSEYGKQSFYCKLAQAFVHGVQPGRVSSWIVYDNRPDGHGDIARPFLRKIARLRSKLRNFLAFGTMLEPLALQGTLPRISSTWTDYGGVPVTVTVDAIQTGVYRSAGGGEIAVLLVNSSMTDTLEFAFDFPGGRYGCGAGSRVREVRENRESIPEKTTPPFTRSLRLQPMDAVAYIFDNCGSFPWPVFLPAIFPESPVSAPQ